MELTKSELEIMDVLWDSKDPLSRSDLLSQSENKSWKDSSVHILLNGLLAKEAIREAGFVKRSKTYGRVFAPTLTREEYYAATVFCHREKPDVSALFQAFLRRPEVKAVHRAELLRILQEENDRQENQDDKEQR